MKHLIAVLRGGHRARRLCNAFNADVPPPPRRSSGRSGRRSARRSQAANMAVSGSTRPGWTRASRRATISTPTPTAPGRRRRQSRPTSRITACSRCSTICRRRAPAGSSKRAPRIRSSKIGAAYQFFLDTAAIEAKGLAPFEPWLNDVRGLKSRRELRGALRPRPTGWASARRSASSSPRTTRSPTATSLASPRAASGCQTAITICRKIQRSPRARGKYLQHLTNVLTLAGEANPAARAKAILDFETSVAKVHWTRVESRDATKTYNMMTFADLTKRAPGLRLRDDAGGARHQGSGSDRRPAERDHRHRETGREGAARSAQGPAAGPVARQLFGLSAERLRQGKLRFLRNGPFRHAGAGGALEACGRLHRRRSGRRRQQALRRALLSAGNQGGGRRTGEECRRGDGAAASRR